MTSVHTLAWVPMTWRGLRRGQLRRNRLEAVDVLQGAHVPIGTGSSGAAGLPPVQVDLALRAHHHVVAGPGGRDAARVAAPGRRPRRPRREPALQDLVPADQPPPARRRASGRSAG